MERQPGVRGFTLVELIAVMILAAVLAATAAVALGNITNSRSALAAKHLLHDLTFARQRAVAVGYPTWVVFDTASETWSVKGESSANPGLANATVLTDPATAMPYTVTLNSGSFVGVQIVTAAFDGDVEIGFDWLGRPLNGAENSLAAAGSVTLTNNHVLGVAVSTGHVTYTAP